MEIDESLLTKSKNNCDWVLPKQSVFDGIGRETKDSFVVTVPNKTGCTILDKITENIASRMTKSFVAACDMLLRFHNLSAKLHEILINE